MPKHDADTLQNRAAKGEQDPPRLEPAAHGPEHERLERFVGRWNTEGRAHEGPFGPAAAISAVETFEWLPGGLFLIHRLTGRLGDKDMACVEIIGADPSGQGYVLRSFYNDGTHNVWSARLRDDNWTLTGEWPQEGKTIHVRCSAVFGAAGTTLSAKWEHSNDGVTWQRFWETRLVKT